MENNYLFLSIIFLGISFFSLPLQISAMSVGDINWALEDNYNFALNYTQEDAKKELQENPQALLDECTKICTGNSHKVRMLIRAGADVNKRSEKSWIPLHHASCSENSEIVRLLLECGSEINALTGENETPLHLAATRGLPEIIELLVNAGAMINFKGKYSNTPLIDAASSYFYQSQTNALKLIELNADVTTSDNFGYSPLHYAVRRKKEKLIELLISKGADPFAKVPIGRYVGYTSLHFAAANSNKSTCALFLASLYCVNNNEKCKKNREIRNTLQNIIVSQLLYDKDNDLTSILECSGYNPLSAIFEITQAITNNLAQIIKEKNQETFITSIRNYFIGEFYRKKIHQLAQKLVFIKDKEGKTAIDVTGTWYNAKSKDCEPVKKLLTQVVAAQSYDDLPDEIKNIAEERIKERVSFLFKK